ncbi:MAG: divergent PAP2 family protein [Clostridia bacterium]|nr:divergent PAP2 family protein [Clostridia bacterium]
MTFGMFMSGLWQNRVLLSAATGWAAAQVLKTIIHALLEDEWKLERLVGSGGMPSSHAATVCALVTAAAYNYGPNSFEFTISFLLAIIVLHDARGVRLETGKQAEILNEIVKYLRMEEGHTTLPEKELKELIGHTPVQVGAGMVIGFIVGIVLH